MTANEYTTEFNPFDPAHLAEPSVWWRRLTRDAPVLYQPDMCIYFVTGYEPVLSVLKDTNTFSSLDSNAGGVAVPPEVAERLPHGYPHLHPSLVNNDPPGHTQIRRLLARYWLNRSVLESYRPMIAARVDELLVNMLRYSEIEFMSEFAQPLPIGVMSSLLGLDDELDVATIKRWSDAAFEVANPRMPHKELVDVANRLADEEEFFLKFIERRRQAPSNDLTSKMIAVCDQEGINGRTLLSILTQILAAGNETTTNFLGNLVYTLLSDRQRWVAVRDDRASLMANIEEGLRFRSSINGLFRTATTATTLCGVEIPQGALLFVAFGSSGHDASRFDNPGDFCATRTNSHEHLAFGKGAHFCLGAPLARIMSEIAMDALLDRMPDARLVDPYPPFVPNIINHGPRELRLSVN